jgi:hypothetical protein
VPQETIDLDAPKATLSSDSLHAALDPYSVPLKSPVYPVRARSRTPHSQNSYSDPVSPSTAGPPTQHLGNNTMIQPRLLFYLSVCRLSIGLQVRNIAPKLYRLETKLLLLQSTKAEEKRRCCQVAAASPFPASTAAILSFVISDGTDGLFSFGLSAIYATPPLLALCFIKPLQAIVRLSKRGAFAIET